MILPYTYGSFHFNQNPMCLIFLAFLRYVSNYFSKNILVVQSDLGKEFRPLQKLLQSCGIVYRITCPYSHAQNGNVECCHRHIIETGLSLLTQASMPSQYWYEAFQTDVFLINRMPTSINNHKSYFQILFCHPPDYKFLCTFGSIYWPNLRPFNCHKTNMRSRLCVCFGYDPYHKGYNCLHVQSGCVYVSRDVQFNKAHFPFALAQIATLSKAASSSLHIPS